MCFNACTFLKALTKADQGKPGSSGRPKLAHFRTYPETLA